MSDAVDARLAGWRGAIDHRLARVAETSRALPDGLRSATHYSLTGEGKRLRGLLVMAAHDAARGRGDVSGLAAAVEVVHAYSLVHDDLPCMDNDHTRRGRPTTHRAFDVPTATIVGVVMVPLAVEQVLEASAELGLAEDATRSLVEQLMRASGASGMVGGQLLDLAGESQSLSVGELEVLHRAKTGALITCALFLGARAANAPAATIEALTTAGDALGLAFQIADDVLDATASSEALGKTAGIDAALAKSTYASILGVPAASDRRDALVEDAMDHLSSAGLRTPPLERLARFIAARQS